ncbi:MAG: hypothetical protein WB711_06435 [Terriglobales bacterium]
MLRFKTPQLLLFLVLGLIAPGYSYAANYCIAVSGGFGGGGTSFMGINFVLPDDGKCEAWSGFTKTASTVILTTSGTGCLSSDGKVLTVSVFSADPPFLGAGQFGADYIQLCPAGVKSCPIGAGSDQGAFSGPAAPETCTAKLLHLPSKHD